VVRKVTRGTRFMITVKVPAGGRITITGADLRTTRRMVSRAGRYQLAVELTASAAKRLNTRRTLTVLARVGYTPTAGQASSARLVLTVKNTLQRAATDRSGR